MAASKKKAKTEKKPKDDRPKRIYTRQRWYKIDPKDGLPTFRPRCLDYEDDDLFEQDQRMIEYLLYKGFTPAKIAKRLGLDKESVKGWIRSWKSTELEIKKKKYHPPPEVKYSG